MARSLTTQNSPNSYGFSSPRPSTPPRKRRLSPTSKASADKEAIVKRRPKESQGKLENETVDEDGLLNEEESLAGAEMSHEEASPPVVKMEAPGSPENGEYIFKLNFYMKKANC